ncbi:gamma-glutamyltransferase [Lederbergia citri]|uniref:Gamma-glutamyltransferase n=1 Tax=Lederbergia citri TaxID=2833580 RepID=A0A942YHP8_9BACI|nr:gamma-glutamyltransferase [Lederbergia citri]MBS4195620.1 gamma-glutamyltransferase [Lederbergia citri]
MLKKLISLCLFLNLIITGGVVHANSVSSEQDSTPSVTDLIGSQESYGVSASHPRAVEVGMKVLENGGNAADAAIAVSYTLSVVEPFASGIGGGGQMLLIPPKTNKPVVYDYRVQATSDKKRGSKKSGVPGFVKGMDAIHRDYGSKPFAELISPAIDFAEKGVEVEQLLSERLTGAIQRMPVKDLPHFYPDKKPIKPGETLKQTELAKTLTKIKENGPNAFYKGEISESFIKAVPYVDKKDLEDYEIQKPEPVTGKLKEWTVYSASPPLTGVPLVQSLKLAEKMNIAETKGDEGRFTHLMTEISRVTKNDRIKEIGDPTFNKIDVDELVSDAHIEKLVDNISPSKISTVTEDDGENVNDSNTDTTHFVIVDKEGMMISATNTLSNFFGSGKYTDGYFINNATEHQFSTKKDSPNRYEPNKRPRSSTTPTILINGERAIGIGTPGGGRIPSVLAQVLARHLYLDESFEEAVRAKRFYGKDEYLYVEDGFPEEVKDDMRNRGYKVQAKHLSVYFGGIQALEVNKKEDTIYGIADLRRGGTWDSKGKNTYTVQKGDTLWIVANKYETSIDKIKNLNKLESTDLYPGQQLKIPEPGTSNTYTVVSGDTLYKISLKLDIPMSELRLANPQIENPQWIYPGEKLNVP